MTRTRAWPPGLVNTGRMAGGSIGLAILGTVAWSVVANTARSQANARRTCWEHPPPDGPMHLSDSARRPPCTLDPAAALDDLDRLDETVGDARVVAIGESAHYNREFFQLSRRVLSYLAGRHHFIAYLQESGFVEDWLVNDWVRGGRGGLGQVMAGPHLPHGALGPDVRSGVDAHRQPHRI